ncbi:regulatory protein GemA [Histophilus somni]|uniref:gp16 family protein n=1 Tax=Histophilus somni TaxID=731 RepID=UPI00109C100C|nr:regulatory protein GemA [Histophilus somni]THA21139.1 regulatory protein GemA [Histophilus somni]
MYTKPKYIQLIHIAKQKLAIDEFSYRAMLKRITGKESTTKMSLAELMMVMHELEQKGFKKTAKKPTHSPSTKSAVAKSNIAAKIRAIWINMHKQGMIRDGSEQALNAWVRSVANPILRNQNQPLVLNVGALEDQMASIVLERLKKWQQRLN